MTCKIVAYKNTTHEVRRKSFDIEQFVPHVTKHLRTKKHQIFRISYKLQGALKQLARDLFKPSLLTCAMWRQSSFRAVTNPSGTFFTRMAPAFTNSGATKQFGTHNSWYFVGASAVGSCHKTRSLSVI